MNTSPETGVRRRPPETTRREARRLHDEEGVDVPELAKRYRVAQSTVYRWLRRVDKDPSS